MTEPQAPARGAATKAAIIDGKAVAAELRADLAQRVGRLKSAHGVTPGLTVVLVGDDPASAIYVRNKGKAAAGAGMVAADIKLPADTAQADLLQKLAALNADPGVHGILVQLPLPGHIDAGVVVDAIDPDKDVDGLHVVNAGRLAAGIEGIVPCTPLGCLILLKRTLGALEGKKALVLGRSNLVGKPMAQLLVRESCTVTIAHSRTRDLAGECRAADILVAATGRPEMVRGDWIKPGATVIDVGINRLDTGGGTSKLVGDVAFDEASSVAGAITPVPGGVGPMTIACLLENTYAAACRSVGAPPQAPAFPSR
ncbi:MAG: bifunctional methylenetetrahydrofolate dehydrogenase/methenyltetrahydrofolate cyclohydrolase FolD [Proteobacteria bacterium]|nr:bifunctional methylenetetrahydrofolate dehydrogenase/methenyltetrahydrofolate cyclohydrolase FolD [Pseudomonadota bacterium]